MPLFDRYSTNLDSVSLALWEMDDAYCNPKVFFVTESECIKYIESLKEARKANREWVESRRGNWMFITKTCCTLFCLLSLYFIYCHPSFFLLLMLPFGTSVCVIEGVDKFFQIWQRGQWDIYYPPQNENIEMLFNYYLWKRYLLQTAPKKNKDEQEAIIQFVKKVSHPYQEKFEEIVKREFANPTEEYAIGDVKFGMTLQELQQTYLFKGVDIETDSLNLGYLRTNTIVRMYNFPLGEGIPFVHFKMDERKLEEVEIGIRYYDRHTLCIKQDYVNCCKYLNDVWGNPSNLLLEHVFEDRYVLFPNNKAIFRAGRRAATLFVRENGVSYYKSKELVLQIKTEESGNRQSGVDNQVFSESWFGTYLSDGIRSFGSYDRDLGFIDAGVDVTGFY